MKIKFLPINGNRNMENCNLKFKGAKRITLNGDKGIFIWNSKKNKELNYSRMNCFMEIVGDIPKTAFNKAIVVKSTLIFHDKLYY